MLFRSLTTDPSGFKVPGYSQNGGTLNGDGDLTAKSEFYWSSGTMTGSGKTVVGAGVTNGIVHTTDYGVSEPVLSRTLENNGVISHQPGYYANNLTLTTGGVLDNRGTYLFTDNTGIDGGGGAIINSGVFGKTGGGGATNIYATLTNTNGGSFDIKIGRAHV